MRLKRVSPLLKRSTPGEMCIRDSPIEAVGKKLRAKMVWLSANASQPDNEQAANA